MSGYNELLNMLPQNGFASMWEHPLSLVVNHYHLSVYAAANYNKLLIIHDGNEWHDIANNGNASTKLIVKTLKNNLWKSKSMRY